MLALLLVLECLSYPNQRTLGIYNKGRTMLRLGVSKRKVKGQKSERKMAKGVGEAQEIGRLHMVVMEMQSKLSQSHKLNHLYLTQIKELEEDNLTLCERLQELKVQQEGTNREHILQHQKLKAQLQELVKVVSFIQIQLDNAKSETIDCRTAMEEMRDQTEAGRMAQVRNSELASDLERGKVKLLESQKYWITRCQTLLAEERTEAERTYMSREAQLCNKLNIVSEQLRMMEKEVQQKTAQIYRLIQHIYSLAG